MLYSMLWIFLCRSIKMPCHPAEKGAWQLPPIAPPPGSAFDLARAQVWSNFKHHSTIKFLIITPQGTISYISHCAVGRISDKEIVEQSDLINYLLPGEIIIADRGFRYAIYAHMALAEIKIPLFAKGKKAV